MSLRQIKDWGQENGMDRNEERIYTDNMKNAL